MSRREPPRSAQSLAQRVENLCRDQEIPVGRARRLIGVIVVGQILRATEVGIVKGASNIEVRLGTARTRVSSDLDTVRRGTLEEYQGTLERALREGWHGFTGILRDEGQISAPVPTAYRPRRFRLKLSFRGGDFVSFTFEVSAEEVGSLVEPEDVHPTEAADWFAALGLPAPDPVPVLPLAHQIAQKLHACTAPDADGWVNDRAHDLVDLQLALEAIGVTELGKIREVAERLFRSRQLHSWPPHVTPREGWEAAYEKQAQGLGVRPDLDAAVAWANELISSIAGAEETDGR